MQMGQSFIDTIFFFASFLEWAFTSDQVQTTNSLPCHVMYALNNAIAMHMPQRGTAKMTSQGLFILNCGFAFSFPGFFPPVFLSCAI